MRSGSAIPTSQFGIGIWRQRTGSRLPSMIPRKVNFQRDRNQLKAPATRLLIGAYCGAIIRKAIFMANVNTEKGAIGILTGGGDVPGLNPAIRAVTIRSEERRGGRKVSV